MIYLNWYPLLYSELTLKENTPHFLLNFLAYEFYNFFVDLNVLVN